MLDLRTVPTLSESMVAEARTWQNWAFVWKQWGPSTVRQEHDHCRFCWACICDARDHDPYDRPGPVAGGHYRNAFYAKKENGAHIWVCRSCFKRLRSLAGWTINRQN